MILDSGNTTTHIARQRKFLDPYKYTMKPEPVVPGSSVAMSTMPSGMLPWLTGAK